ncbi:FtsH protease activity modulator HflK [Candidatus Fermentibacteria bacterium]|nr:MAG: FtsH protease activity modulator HflK [Candidatus Fermentibacteria bacterium]
MRVVTRQFAGFKSILLGLLVVVLVIWLLIGGPFYIVGPEEQGVVLTFGKMTSVSGPGFHFKLPWPVQTVRKAPVNVVQRVEIGFRSVESGGTTSYVGFTDRDMLREAQMLTGDENIINCSVIVQYRIGDISAYLFNVREPDETLRDISEACIRQVIGDNAVDAVLTTGKLEIQNRTMEQVQEMADNYGMGINVVAVQLKDVQPPAQVSDAFKDVATAREDMQAYINEAEGYRNQVIPEARADSVTTVNEALGYAAVRINTARGAAGRFVAVAAEYSKSPQVTSARLHLEMLGSVLAGSRITVVDRDAGALTHYNLEGGM